MRKSELFNKLNIFFSRFQGDTAAGAIKGKFLSCLEGMNDHKGLCDGLESLKSVYEAAVRLTEKEAAEKDFGELARRYGSVKQLIDLVGTWGLADDLEGVDRERYEGIAW